MQHTGALMYLSGIDGDFMGDPQFVVWMPRVLAYPKERPFRIESVMLGKSEPDMDFGATGGSQPKPNDIATVTRKPGAGSQMFYRLMTTGRHIAEIRFHLQKGQRSTGSSVLEFVLSNCLLKDIMMHGAADPGPIDASLVETIGFHFTRIEHRFH